MKTVHCPQCRQNVDSVLCPRCGVLTERGRVAQRAARKPRGFEPTVYTVHLRRVKDGGVDAEAS